MGFHRNSKFHRSSRNALSSHQSGLFGAVLVPASLQVAERVMLSIETSLDKKLEQLMRLLDEAVQANVHFF